MSNTNELKALLLEEKARLESELSHVGYKNPDIAGDWQPAATNLNEPTADANEVELEARLLEVDAALTRMDVGTYGVCRVCGAAIEDARLHANPAAPTCIAHREG
jgi:RNA polymerase-binding transcription factor DksA